MCFQQEIPILILFQNFKGDPMNKFYQLLLIKPVSPNPYRKALIVITKASHQQMNALTSDLAWQQWAQAKAA
jgi:hypothetical protein